MRRVLLLIAASALFGAVVAPAGAADNDMLDGPARAVWLSDPDGVDGDNGTEQGDPVIGARGRAAVSAHGGRIQVDAPGLIPGHVYTLWVAYFNDTTLCVDGCNGPDLATAGGGLIWIDGLIAGDDGVGRFDGRLASGAGAGYVGKTPPPPFAFAAYQPGPNNEFHAVVRSHGPQLPGLVADQLSSFGGGCEVNGGGPKHAECVGVPARAVQSEHQQPDRALPERMVADNRLELRHHVAVPPAPEVGVDTILQRLGTQLVEPADLELRKRAVGEILERFAPPDVQCGSQLCGGGRRLVPHERPSLRQRRLEPMRIDAGGIDDERIPVVAGHEHRCRSVGLAGGLQHTSQAGDSHPQGLLLAGPVVRPQFLEDAIGRHDTIRLNQEHGGQDALLASSHVCGDSVVVGDLEGAKDPIVHVLLSRTLRPGSSEQE